MHRATRALWLLFASLVVGCQPAASPTSPAARPAATVAPAANTPSAPAAAAATSSSTAASAAAAEMPRALQPPVTVRVGLLSSLADSGVYIGYERGYFRDLGLELQLETIPDPNTVATLTSTNQLEVGGTGVLANAFQAAGRGINLKMVADKGQNRPGFGYFSLIVRSDLLDSGQVRTLADLRGRTITRLAQCDSGLPLFVRVLERGGLTPDDVETAYMGFPDQNAALGNRATDGAFQVEPLMTLAAERGIARRFVGGDEVYPNQQLAVLYYSPDFAQRTEAAQRFMVAYVRALRDYNDAFTKGIDKAEIAQILAKHTTVKDLALYDKMIPAGLDPDGRVNVPGVRDDVALYGRLGCASGEVAEVGRVVDESFVNYAVGVLGPYQR